MAANPNNPFDGVGQIHDELLAAYFADDNLPTTLYGIANRVSLLAVGNTSFNSLSTTPYSFHSLERVGYISSHLDTCTPEIIENSLDTSAAKLSLTNYISSLMSLCATENDYAVIYSFIVSYEATVLGTSSFTSRDKMVILKTASISRFSAYTRKKRPKKNRDPEWDYMVGNIIAGADGADEGSQERIIKALIVGVWENQ